MLQVAGVACIAAGRSRAISARSRCPSRAISDGHSSTPPPRSSGSSSSKAAMSKLTVVTASSRSPAASPGASAIDCRQFDSAACPTITCLGVPVLPDVVIT